MKKTALIHTDYQNPFNRRIWLEERRRDLIHYFDTRNMNYGHIPHEPYWCVVPRTSIWQISSLGTPGFEDWFGIAGDHPTDVVSLNYFAGSPRNVLVHFVTKWLNASERLQQGEVYGDFRIEQIEQRHTIGELIENRAKKLKRWVECDELWQTVVPLSLTPKSNDDDSDESAEIG